MTTIAWLTWLLLGALVLGGVGWWLLRTGEFVAPIPICLATLGFYVLTRAGYLLWFDRPPITSAGLPVSDQRALIAVTLLLTSAAVIALLLGHRAPSARRVGKSIRFRVPEPTARGGILVGTAFGVVGVVAVFYLVISVGGLEYAFRHQYEVGHLLHDKQPVFQLTRFMVVGVALLLVNPSSGRSRWWVWITAAAAAVALLPLGRRGLLVLAVIYPISLYHLAVRPIPLRWMTGSVVAGFLILLFLGYLRPLSGDRITRALAVVVRQPQLAVHFAFNSTGELKVFDAATMVVRDMPSVMSPTYGKTFLRTPFMVIPRRLWEAKPVTLGEVIVQQHLPQLKTGYPPMAVGEFYAAGGPAAVLLGFFAFGWVCRVVWEWWRNTRGVGNATLFIAFCYLVFDFTRVGDPSRTTVFFLLGSVSLVVAFSLAAGPSKYRQVPRDSI